MCFFHKSNCQYQIPLSHYQQILIDSLLILAEPQAKKSNLDAREQRLISCKVVSRILVKFSFSRPFLYTYNLLEIFFYVSIICIYKLI